MASPQKENGYTAIANEIMDALIKFRIPGNHRQVLDFIFRNTYGYINKKTTTKSYSEIAKATGLHRQNVKTILDDLSLHTMTTVIDNGDRRPKTIGINKNYEDWKPFSKKSVIEDYDRAVIEDYDKSVIEDHDSAPIYKTRNNIYSSYLLKNGEKYTPEEEFVRELKTLFPEVDFESEFKKISAWCLGNPSKRKTKRGSKKFITSWMTRAQDKINESKPKYVDVEF